MGVIPLTFLAELLVIITNYFLGVSWFMMVLSAGTILILSVGITALGMYLGSRYPKFGTANPMQISMGFGGIVYMILAMTYAGITIILEAGPVYLFSSAQWTGRAIESGTMVWVGAALLFLFLVQVVFITVIIRLGLSAIETQASEP